MDFASQKAHKTIESAISTWSSDKAAAVASLAELFAKMDFALTGETREAAEGLLYQCMCGCETQDRVGRWQ